FFYIFIISVLISGNAFAQSGPENIVKLNIFSPIVRTLSLSYERVLSADNSFQVNFFYTGASIGDTRFRGFGITPEYRFYLSESKESPAGFYLAPFLRYQNFNLTVEDESVNEPEATLSNFGGGVLIGGQWIFKEKISLDTFIGPAYTAGDIKVEDGTSEEQFETGILSGFGVRFGVTIGYAF
ncbi:MAG: DUF3575 domain-containing protein, partial [Bacteroidota bacterium]